MRIILIRITGMATRNNYPAVHPFACDERIVANGPNFALTLAGVPRLINPASNNPGSTNAGEHR
jgi:hypothetical protein